MKLKIDTREQAPLNFKEGVFAEIVREGLPVGDYWCEVEGAEIPIVFERKSLGDLFGTMTSGYARFKREMARARQAGITLVLIIEGSMKDVAKGYQYSKFDGNAMLKKLFMLWIRYDLFPVFCEDRRTASRFIEETFSAVARNYKAGSKKDDVTTTADESEVTISAQDNDRMDAGDSLERAGLGTASSDRGSSG